MKCTVGGLLLLVLAQGTFWLVNSTTSSSNHIYDSTTSAIGLRGEAAKKQFQFQRDAVLQQMRRLTTNRKTRKHSICQVFPANSKTTTSKQLWMNQVGAILAASQHPEDTNFFFETWTKRLLSEISPPLLEQSATTNSQTTESSLGDIVAGVLDVVYNKLMKPDTAPPLRIAVLGGSHTEGTTCAQVSVTIPEADASSTKSLSTLLSNPMFCAWPFRLESFLNTLAGFRVVEIVNLAEDGTDTGFMTPLVQNGIYPPSLMPYGPDIILHAYRPTDYDSGATTSAELLQTMQRELNMLSRGGSAPHPCRIRPPLLIHLDATTMSNDNMANIITIQSWQAIDRAIEADHQVEPGSMAAHMALTWVTAFNLMDLTLQYCKSDHDNSKRALADNIKSNSINVTQCKDPATRSASASPSPTCPFCFFASPFGTVRTTMELQHYIKGFVVHNEGWQVLADMSTGWSRKVGLVATHANANILFRVAQIDRPVRSLHIMTLRSNGVEWQGSLARFRLAVMTPPSMSLDHSNNMDAPQPKAETRFDVTGYHDSAKHTTYHFTVDMTQYEAPIGSDLMVSVELVEGSRFKILGLMLCS
jgi:hypothetical protein